MKQRGSVGTVILIVFLVIVAVTVSWIYFVLLRPHRQLEKARTPDTTMKIVPENLVIKTEIKESGYNVGIVVSPSRNDVISGEVTIKAANAPEGAKHVGFAISSSFETLGAEGPNLGFDSSATGGWEQTLDTTDYKNGTYYVALFVFATDFTSDPIGVANAQVEIKN